MGTAQSDDEHQGARETSEIDWDIFTDEMLRKIQG